MRNLASAILNDPDAPPMLLLAAWHYLHGWEKDWLPDLVARAGEGEEA